MGGNDYSSNGVSRRSFLKGGLLATASALAAGSLAGCSTADEGASPSVADGAVEKTPFYEVYNTDLLIMGGGYEGTNAALAAHNMGLNAIIVDKGPYGFSGDAGFNWAVFCHDYTHDDPVAATAFDVAGNMGLTDQSIAYEVNKIKLAAQGVGTQSLNLGTATLQRNEDGSIYVVPATEDVVLYKSIYPRHEADLAVSKGIQVFDRTMITDYIVQDGIFTGAMGIYLPTGTFRVFRAKAGIQTPGSNAWMFGWETVAAKTITSPDNTGDLNAIALRKGCRLQNMEQIGGDLIMSYPSGIAYSYNGVIGSEPIYKDSVCDSDGNYWMRDRELSRLEFLAECTTKIQEGKTGPNGGLLLDLRDVDGQINPQLEGLANYYKRNVEPLKEKFGIDVRKELVEVQTEIGGVLGHPVVDSNMMCDIPGIFHANSSCAYIPTTNHYFGTQYAVLKACEYMESVDLSALEEQPWDQIEAEYARVVELRDREVSGSIRPHVVRRNIQKTVGDNLHLYRTKEGMEECLKELRRIREEEIPLMAPQRKSPTYNTEWKEAIENINMLDFSESMAVSALAREESRGRYLRADFPERDDENFLCKMAVSYDGGSFNVSKIPIDMSVLGEEQTKQLLG